MWVLLNENFDFVSADLDIYPRFYFCLICLHKLHYQLAGLCIQNKCVSSHTSAANIMDGNKKAWLSSVGFNFYRLHLLRADPCRANVFSGLYLSLQAFSYSLPFFWFLFGDNSSFPSLQCSTFWFFLNKRMKYKWVQLTKLNHIVGENIPL